MPDTEHHFLSAGSKPFKDTNKKIVSNVKLKLLLMTVQVSSKVFLFTVYIQSYNTDKKTAITNLKQQLMLIHLECLF